MKTLFVFLLGVILGGTVLSHAQWNQNQGIDPIRQMETQIAVQNALNGQAIMRGENPFAPHNPCR